MGLDGIKMIITLSVKVREKERKKDHTGCKHGICNPELVYTLSQTGNLWNFFFRRN